MRIFVYSCIFCLLQILGFYFAFETFKYNWDVLMYRWDVLMYRWDVLMYRWDVFMYRWEICDLFMPIWRVNTLSKYPGGFPILHWRLKLNSKNSAGKYLKKLSTPDQLIFHRGAKQKFFEYLATIMEKILETNLIFMWNSALWERESVFHFSAVVC